MIEQSWSHRQWDADFIIIIIIIITPPKRILACKITTVYHTGFLCALQSCAAALRFSRRNIWRQTMRAMLNFSHFRCDSIYDPQISGTMRAWVSPCQIARYVRICLSRGPFIHVTKGIRQMREQTCRNIPSRGIAHRGVVRSKGCCICSTSSSAIIGGIFFS